MYIQSNIRALRRKAGMTQKDLASKLDKTQMTVGDYERGRATPPLPVILQLCEIFDVDLQTLVHHDIENDGYATAETLAAAAELKLLREQLKTEKRLTRLQEQRLHDLEREIREHAPALARRLGL